MAHSKNEQIEQADFDARWKIFLEQFAEQVILKFFPNLAAERDFKKPIIFLDKEFQKIFADWEKKGWTLGDKLMEVPIKSGRKKLVLIHFDIHRSHDTFFKELMWRRGYRIMDRHPNCDFTAIAIYIGNHVPPKPDQYIYEFEGTKFIYKFNICIVKNQNEKELLSSKNPLDIALLAMYYIIKSQKDYNLLSSYKIGLARLCFEKGYTRQEIQKLLIFVNYTIALPKKEEELFKNEMVSIMEKYNRPLKETRPIATRTMEIIFFGKTQEERDEERDKVRDKEFQKKHILRHHQLGMEVEKIALFLDVEEEVVLAVIAENENQEK